MKRLLLFTSTLLTSALSLSAMTTILDDVHVDVGIAYEDDEWDLHVHDEDADQEFEPDEVIFFGDDRIKITIPSMRPFSFLGNASDDAYVFPQTDDGVSLFLGYAAEEVADGIFDGPIELMLVSVEGPGDFFAYFTDTLGNPDMVFSSDPGVTAPNILEIGAGDHGHLNWAFNAEGFYKVFFKARGTLQATGELVESDPVAYQFGVNAIPEPGTIGLLMGLAALGGAVFLKRRRKS